MEQPAGKFPAFPTVAVPFALAAGFYRAAVPPEGLVHMYAAGAVHLLPVGTLGAQQAAP